MTRINRITIHGFKSFANKTDILLEERFNCILGANGSGKSNIGDALCFVLGRLSAKSMRAEKASNLIFNGGKNKKPASTGTVEIVFSNDEKEFPLDAKEIVITRTIQKDGGSTYYVNNKKKTRTEILDLLAISKINPDGYNIVLQGDITRFVTMTPLERRKIIEEISDVSIYEDKKHKAMLELEKVEEKLNSAEIILKERKTYLKELKKDRDQALEFKQLKDKIDSHKATYIHLQMQDRKAKKEVFDKEVEKHQLKIQDSEKKVNEAKEAIAKLREQVVQINQDIEQKGEKEQVEVHRKIEELKVNIAKEKTRVSTLKDEINKIGQRKEQFRQEARDLEEKADASHGKKKELEQVHKEKAHELKQVEESIAQFKKKNNIESSVELEKGIEERDHKIEEKQEEVQKIRVRQQELLREKDRMEYQLQTVEEKVRKVAEVAKQNKDQITNLQDLKNNFKAATLRLNTCLDQDSSFASQLANARRNVVDAQEKLSKIQAKEMTLQASISNNQALNSILSQKKKFPGVYGTVAELGQVPKKYAPALEAAAAGRMQFIVVDNDQTAAECISFLKANRLGAASFIPLNKIKTQEISGEDKGLLKTPGVHDFAINIISFRAEYKKAFLYVFGNTLIVEDIDVARKVGVGRIKMASLDGNLAEASGVMRGGFNARRESVGFLEKDTVEEREKMEEGVAQLESVIAALEVKREGNMREITSLRTSKAELEAEIIKLEKTLHLETGDLDATTAIKKELSARLLEMDEEINKVQREIVALNKDLGTLKEEKNVLRSQVNELRNPRLLAQLTAFEETRQRLREEMLRLESDAKNMGSQLSQLIAPEQEKMKEIIKQHDKEEAQFKEEIHRLSESVHDQEKVLEQKEKDSKEFYSKYKELFTLREKVSAQITALENDTEKWREQARSSERDVNLVSLQNAEIKAKLAGLEEEFARYPHAVILENKHVDELKQEISKFEVMLGQLSTVNMKALEVYDQIEQEYNKLIEKKESLEKEKTDVMMLMNEIETKKKEQFMKTFEMANEHFGRIFSTLFTKGKAYLELDNPTNPFEDGLSIKVKISGNRFMDLKALSGGEKTLTALSFIFAIQEYQPASFYILDEIDAALDKHNAQLLANLIQAYSDRAQYIVISHNDALISQANTLYGVSMVDGISKVTSLKI
ncbi:chromosome segregation protein SMC [Candidatus Woesearchaeota archaeon]|nr:chromosome segregation protein SMC [Candidatus Woesearchaeota archaeon]